MGELYFLSSVVMYSKFSVRGILQARILEWIAMHICRGSSWSRDRTQVSCIADGLFTIWATREAYETCNKYQIRNTMVHFSGQMSLQYHESVLLDLEIIL